MSLVWQSVSKWEIRSIAPKTAGIATPPRAGQASPSPTDPSFHIPLIGGAAATVRTEWMNPSPTDPLFNSH